MPDDTRQIGDVMAYGLRGLEDLLRERGLSEIMQVDRKLMQIILPDDTNNYMKFRRDGAVIGLRQAEQNGSKVSISEDGGKTFRHAAAFENEMLAVTFVKAWLSGWI